MTDFDELYIKIEAFELSFPNKIKEKKFELDFGSISWSEEKQRHKKDTSIKKNLELKIFFFHFWTRLNSYLNQFKLRWNG